MTADGGAAGLGVAGVTSNWGGSNGGTGGLIWVATTSSGYASTVTVHANGGAKSLAVGGGAATDGSDGGAGVVINFFM